MRRLACARRSCSAAPWPSIRGTTIARGPVRGDRVLRAESPTRGPALDERVALQADLGPSRRDEAGAPGEEVRGVLVERCDRRLADGTRNEQQGATVGAAAGAVLAMVARPATQDGYAQSCASRQVEIALWGEMRASECHAGGACPREWGRVGVMPDAAGGVHYPSSAAGSHLWEVWLGGGPGEGSRRPRDVITIVEKGKSSS